LPEEGRWFAQHAELSFASEARMNFTSAAPIEAKASRIKAQL
jgi:hypothetical protein